MTAFLNDLTKVVLKAQDLSDLYVHTPLELKNHVRVQLTGFYDDPDAEMDIRLYFTKKYLSEFLQIGPEKCLRSASTGWVVREGDGQCAWIRHPRGIWYYLAAAAAGDLDSYSLLEINPKELPAGARA